MQLQVLQCCALECWNLSCQLIVVQKPVFGVRFFNRISCQIKQIITIPVNWQENQQNLEWFRSIRCWITTWQMGNGWVGCALLSFGKISKYYKYSKLTREPTEFGILPLNWLLDKFLANGKWVSGLCSSFFLQISKYYNSCKLTREPTEFGMLPLNWFLAKLLPNGKWVSGLCSFFFLENLKILPCL